MRNYKDATWKEKVTKVIQQIQEQDIKFVRLQFTDINGMLKNLAVSSKNIEQSLKTDNHSTAHPSRGTDPSKNPTWFSIQTQQLSPCCHGDQKKNPPARLICDIYTPQNKRFDGDPRYVLERAVEKAAKAGYTFICAPELEFFIVKESETGELPTPIDMAGYFDFHPSDLTDDLRREIADTAEAFGIEIEISHHEVALGTKRN